MTSLRPPHRVDIAQLSAALFDPGPVTNLAASLTDLAARLRTQLGVDLAALYVTRNTDVGASLLAVDVGSPADAALLAPVLGADDDLLGLPTQAVWSGAPVVWPRLLAEAAPLERLAELQDTGVAPEPLRDRLRFASGAAVPLATPNTPRLGALCLISLDRNHPVGASAVATVEQVMRQLSLTVRNHQWRDRNRRTVQVLRAVLESAPAAVVVTDVRERLLYSNQEAGRLFDTDLRAQIGQPLRPLLSGRLRWRFAEPEAYEQSVIHALEHPRFAGFDRLRSADGKVLQRYTAPVSDTSGEPLGRVEMLTDITAAERALEDARMAARETARLQNIEERRARDETALARAAHLMASALTQADVYQHLVDQAKELVGAEVVAVMVIDRDGDITARAWRGIADGILRALIARTDRVLLRRLLGARRALMCSDTHVEAPAVRSMVPDDARAFVLSPLLTGEHVDGVLMVASSRQRAFGTRELRLLGDLTTHAGLAVRNAQQFEHERHVAETLQHALLPDALPSVPGLQLAGLYRAAAGALVGGDFYGAWLLPGGEVAVLVGDVSGKGVEAAGVTAMARYAAEGVSMRERDPGAVVTELSDMLRPRLPDGVFVALTLAVIDLARHVLRWCAAGLPPALLVNEEGTLRALEASGPPAGVFAGERYVSGSAAFAPGDTLFLCTDGLLEARRDGEEFGEERLRHAVVAGVGQPPRSHARFVYDEVSRWTHARFTDDVAIAVVARTAG